MRLAPVLALSGLAVVALSPAARAEVEVFFVHPERYADARADQRYGVASRAPVLRGIREHLDRLGALYLKPDQTLTIDILDIDRAGRFDWRKPYAYDVRILKGITWPRIDVRYTLHEGDRTLLSGEESIVDPNYQMRVAVKLSNDPLRYEKSMLDDWFRARFVEFKSPEG